MKALMIAADRSGAGKTSISVGIAALLSTRCEVQTFKVGMDYIDPSYLGAATGRPCRNLDGFVMSRDEIRAIVDHACEGADVMLVEGVRGLYEGADAIADTGSSAEIAKLLGIPVVLVVNARSITRSAAALVKGFVSFDPQVRIAGVILNNIGGRSHREKATQAIEHICGIPVIGSIPQHREMELEMRHLGLVPFMEKRSRQSHEPVRKIANVVDQHLDLGRLLSCAGEYLPETWQRDYFAKGRETDVRIGIALDEAFNFYYADLFDVLSALGAECVGWSPVHGRPPEAEGYIFGGGYPEVFASELEANDAAREAMRELAAKGTPIYAECGGLMYLTERMEVTRDFHGLEAGGSFGMCGVFAGETILPARRVVSYVEGTSCPESPLGTGSFRGHEFHYSEVRLAKETKYCYRLVRGEGISGGDDGALKERTLGAYTHLSPVPSFMMLSHFVSLCRMQQGRGG
ncbi:MAG: Ni-sirohydrochlorin a,c-diamide synthase [Methanomicrobiales archaeon]|nr:Ni-sirohydrochlorin a,c-diamide synthase [Methanomicrobiales archaeon]